MSKARKLKCYGGDGYEYSKENGEFEVKYREQKFKRFKDIFGAVDFFRKTKGENKSIYIVEKPRMFEVRYNITNKEKKFTKLSEAIKFFENLECEKFIWDLTTIPELLDGYFYGYETIIYDTMIYG